MSHCHSKFSVCFSTIGVTTEKNDKFINEWNHDGQSKLHWVETDFNSFYERCYEFKSDVAVRINWDCNEWTNTYYKHKKVFKKEKIGPNQCYYFAIMVCCEPEWIHFKAVESMDV